jgi:hypothetical protein
MRESRLVMAEHQAPPEQLAAPMRASQFLTVNMVMPTVGDSAKEGASFARLLVDLAALALGRLDAARWNHRQDPGHKFVPAWLAGGQWTCVTVNSCAFARRTVAMKSREPVVTPRLLLLKIAV